MAQPVTRFTLLGSTGSVGTQTLDVVRAHPDRFKILGLACGADLVMLHLDINP